MPGSTGTDIYVESDGSYSKQVRTLGSGTAAQAAVTPTHTTATATTATGAMLAANTSRKYALIQNDGAVDVYIKIGAAAVANQGIRLLANGGSYEMSASFGNLATGAINGITGAGSAVVLVTEGA